MFKSKLINLVDYKDMEITEDMCGTPLNEEELQGMLEKIAKRNVITIDVEVVENGDLIVIDIDSHGERLQRDLPITIGLGLFNIDIESKIIGMKKNEKKSIDYNGAEVSVEVKSIKRRIPAELTDEIIVSLNIEGVNSVNSYKKYLIEKDLYEKKLRILCQKGIDFVLDNSEFYISEDDILVCYEENMKAYIHQAASEQMTLDEFTKTLSGLTIEEFKQKKKSEAPMSIKYMLVGKEYAKKDVNLLYDEEKYETYIQEMTDSSQMTIEEAKRNFSFELFQLMMYKGAAITEIFKYFELKQTV